MSDASATQDEQYSSVIDPAFAAAWNKVYSEPAPTTDETSGAETGAAAAGDQAPAAPAEGAGAAPAADPAQAPGAGSDNAGSDSAAVGQPPTSALGEVGSDTALGSAGGSPSVYQGPTFDAVTAEPMFSTASKQITERMEASFKTTALAEVREKIDSGYFDNLTVHPYRLVGQQVPGFKGDGSTITLRDSEEAKNWQEAVQQLIDEEVTSVMNSKMDDVRPMMTVIQDSIQVLQNNTDLIPGSSNYNQDLHDRFVALAKDYELRVNGKLFGYQVNVQPLINSLRADIARTQGVSSEQQAQARRDAQQRLAQEQPRNQAGQFEAPQAGIASKAGLVGGSGEDDYSVFWNAVGRPNLSI